MANFQKLFEKTEGLTIEYEGITLYWADKFPVLYGDKLIICIESTNSDCTQGISIEIEGSCEIQGKIWKKGKKVKPIFWEDSEILNPKNIEITVFTKFAYVWIQNIWEHINHQGNKSVDSGHNGAAMIVEEIENGRRYRCNDWHPDENFDDIIFTVQRETLNTV